MHKSVLTVAAIAALAMPASGMASPLPRTIGPEPTEAETPRYTPIHRGRAGCLCDRFSCLGQPPA